MIPMFFVVIRAKFAGEKEDPDVALQHYEEHHAHDHDADNNGGANGGASGGSNGGNDGPGKEGH
jgi:hypothetical protein